MLFDIFNDFKAKKVKISVENDYKICFKQEKDK